MECLGFFGVELLSPLYTHFCTLSLLSSSYHQLQVTWGTSRPCAHFGAVLDWGGIVTLPLKTMMHPIQRDVSEQCLVLAIWLFHTSQEGRDPCTFHSGSLDFSLPLILRLFTDAVMDVSQPSRGAQGKDFWGHSWLGQQAAPPISLASAHRLPPQGKQGGWLGLSNPLVGLIPGWPEVLAGGLPLSVV